VEPGPRTPPDSNRPRRAFAYAVVALLAVAGVALLRATRDLLPDALRPLIVEAAKRHALDAELVEAVVRAESRGVPDAVSRAGAIGLMQLTPATASDLARREVEPRELLDPRFNLDLGCLYLKRLLARYGDLRLALMAYNAGPGNVDRWRRQEPDPDRILEDHAFAETRGYVEKVMGYLG